MVSAEDAVTGLLADVTPVLDERQRRLAAAAGARALGRGGIAAVARETGMSLSTIRGGMRELDQGVTRLDGHEMLRYRAPLVTEPVRSVWGR